MARRGRRKKGIGGFAEDLGRLLGSAQSRAQGWLGQRQMIARQLEQIRDTAAGLLTQLAGGGGRGRRSRVALRTSEPVRRPPGRRSQTRRSADGPQSGRRKPRRDSGVPYMTAREVNDNLPCEGKALPKKSVGHQGWRPSGVARQKSKRGAIVTPANLRGPDSYLADPCRRKVLN